MYNRETDMLVPPEHEIAVGDKLDVIRGNGPREGERMGTATIVGFDDDGACTLHFLPDPQSPS
jgi:hypothetical protein